MSWSICITRQWSNQHTNAGSTVHTQLFLSIQFKSLFLIIHFTVAALKLGWVTRAILVNRVMFCPGHPGQTRFKNYPGLTRIGSREPRSWENKIWKHNDGCCCNVRFVSHAHFSKQWFYLLQNAQGAPPFISFVHMHATIAIYSLLRATPITVAGALPLQYAKEYSCVADL